MISDSYVKEDINTVKKRLKEYGLEYNKKLSDVNYFPKNSFSTVDYRPELDTSMEWNEYQVSFYQSLIEVLILMIGIGIIDIAFEVSALSKYFAYLITGRLVQALHVFKYL